MLVKKKKKIGGNFRVLNTILINFIITHPKHVYMFHIINNFVSKNCGIHIIRFNLKLSTSMQTYIGMVKLILYFQNSINYCPTSLNNIFNTDDL